MHRKNKNSKVNYISRLLVMSLAAMIFFAFNLKMKNVERAPVVEGKHTTIIGDNGTKLSITDTIPAMSYKGKKVIGMMVKSSSGMVEVKYDDGSTESITKKEAKKRGFVLPPPPPKVPRPVKAPKHPAPPTPPTVLKIKHVDVNSNDQKEVFVEGDVRRVTGTGPKDIQHNKIDRDDSNRNDTIPERVLTKVDKEAEFPGGPNKWTGYIQRILTENVRDFGDEDYGTCIVKFIVDKNGKVSDVEATTMKGTRLARTAVDAIRKGPKWIPAMQNGQKVNAYRIIPITLKNSGR